jgi:hypothetical protein
MVEQRGTLIALNGCSDRTSQSPSALIIGYQPVHRDAVVSPLQRPFLHLENVGLRKISYENGMVVQEVEVRRFYAL